MAFHLPSRIASDNFPSMTNRLFAPKTQRSCASRLMQPLQPHHMPPPSSGFGFVNATISWTAESY